MVKVIKNYQDNEALRHSFNQLAKMTFGISFEDWYQNGYWTDSYIPYSMVHHGEVIANVSVNRTSFLLDKEKKVFIQLGTVMTKEGYRNQGFIRKLMLEIDKDFSGVEGIYLFANDSVLDFYPKFGFKMVREFQYYKSVDNPNEMTISRVPMNNKKDWHALERILKQKKPLGNFELIDNIGLIMFYVTKFMQTNVYYEKSLKAYVISEVNGSELFIHGVFSEEKIQLDEIIKAFGNTIKRVTLGFVPDEGEGFLSMIKKEKNTTLFVKGKLFDIFSEQRLMFPTLSHA